MVPSNQAAKQGAASRTPRNGAAVTQSRRASSYRMSAAPARPIRSVLTAERPQMADEAVDMWLKPYERPNDTTKAMSDYLSWEVDLIARIERDGTTDFTPLAP